jgi:hypothetical protein
LPKTLIFTVNGEKFKKNSKLKYIFQDKFSDKSLSRNVVLTPKSLDAISEQETWLIIKPVIYHNFIKTHKTVTLIAVKCIFLLVLWKLQNSIGRKQLGILAFIKSSLATEPK